MGEFSKQEEANYLREMNYLFVTIELSVKLKNKFFNEPCFGYYVEKLNGHVFRYIWETQLTEPIKNSDDFNLAAPTRQQVLRWFRNIHNISGEVYKILIANDVKYIEQYKESEYAFKINVNGIPQFNSVDNICYSYEDAELKCLNEMIKLI